MVSVTPRLASASAQTSRCRVGAAPSGSAPHLRPARARMLAGLRRIRSPLAGFRKSMRQRAIGSDRAPGRVQICTLFAPRVPEPAREGTC